VSCYANSPEWNIEANRFDYAGWYSSLDRQSSLSMKVLGAFWMVIKRVMTSRFLASGSSMFAIATRTLMSLFDFGHLRNSNNRRSSYGTECFRKLYSWL
jgi:hypothetical protein